MTNEEARSNLEKLLLLYDDGMIDFSTIRESIKVAIKALKAIDEDLIKRQDALNCFHTWIDKHGDICEPCDMAEYRAIEELPSVMEDEK